MSSDDFMQRAGRLAGWAARTGYSLGKRLPGADAAERGLRSLERTALGELRKRLELVDDPYLTALSHASAMTEHAANGQVATTEVTVVPARGERVEPLRAAMAELLNRSVGLDRERAREYLYAAVLRQLTPDEARILAALADGTVFPLLDVAERTNLGGTGRVLLRCASTVGRSAGVSLFDHVPSYVIRLVGLGLAEIGDEAPSLETQYEILQTDELVRAAEQSVKRARFVRRTLYISRLGASFWLACDPTGAS